MTKVIEVRKAIVDCEKKITGEVKRRTNRNKPKIKELQAEHARLTNSLALLLKDNREETIDKKDDSGETFRAEQEEKEKQKRLEFEKLILAQKDATTQQLVLENAATIALREGREARLLLALENTTAAEKEAKSKKERGELGKNEAKLKKDKEDFEAKKKEFEKQQVEQKKKDEQRRKDLNLAPKQN